MVEKIEKKPLPSLDTLLLGQSSSLGAWTDVALIESFLSTL